MHKPQMHTNNSTQHTPTPWRVINGVEIVSGDDLCVADAYPTRFRIEGRNTGEQDAAFIVRAVNSHGELVAALEAAQNALIHGVCGQYGIDWKSAYDVARAALAKLST